MKYRMTKRLLVVVVGVVLVIIVVIRYLVIVVVNRKKWLFSCNILHYVIILINLLFQETGNQRQVSRSRSAGPDTTSLSSRQGGGGAARMKNINRFSNFVKTGMEAFILASSKMSSPPAESFEVIVSFYD